MKKRGEKLIVCSCLPLTYTYRVNISRILIIEDINDWYSTATRYAKCYVVSGQNKKFKLKYLMNKTLERKTTKELVLQF